MRGGLVLRALGGNSGGDKGAGTDTGFEVALGEQLRVGIEDGETGDFEFGGEGAAGGHLLARGQIAAQDRVTEAGIDLTVQGHVGSAIDGDNRKDS